MFTQSNYVRLFWGPVLTGLAISHAIPSNAFHGVKSDRWNSADSALVWGRAEWELHAELWGGGSSPRSCLFLRRNALVVGALHYLGWQCTA